MYKAFKFRLYPSKEQKQAINKNFGCNRFVYNHYLDVIKNSKFTNVYDYIRIKIIKKIKEYGSDYRNLSLWRSLITGAKKEKIFTVR